MRTNNYSIKWRYSEEGEVTECIISLNEAATDCVPMYKEVAIGRIRRYYKDEPTSDKEKVRKLSLSKALQEFPKHERFPFWESFRNLKTEPKW